MERIASFTVDHDVLVPGLYLSRQGRWTCGSKSPTPVTC